MYLDLIITIILIITILTGISEGFLLQFFSLFGVVLDLIIAKQLTPIIIKKLNLDDIEGNYIITYIGVLAVVYIIIMVVIHMVKLMLRNKEKGILTKLLGGIFGFLKGAIISVIVLLIANYIANFYPNISNYVKDSRVNKVFIEKIHYIEGHIPEKIKNKIEEIQNQKLIKKYFDNLL